MIRPVQAIKTAKTVKTAKPLCPACGSDRPDVCQLTGHVYPVKPVKASKPRYSEKIQYLEPEELDRLLASVRRWGGKRDTAIWTVGYWRGLRASEVGMLQVGDFSPDAGRLYVRRVKGSLSAEYKVGPDEIACLRAWLKVRGEDPGPLFPARGGRPVSRQRLHNLMKRYSDLARLPVDKTHFHCLRHSCAVHLFDRGVDIYGVKDWLGHRNIESTLVYVRMRSVTRDKIADSVYALNVAAPTGPKVNWKADKIRRK
jgi:integrase